jgi:Asp-tRNA(Asn)/Glu-tRNA(Gln) amidotransferase A subunit family amidase
MYGETPNLEKPPRVGYFREYFLTQAHEEVRKNFGHILDKIQNKGAEVSLIPLPSFFKQVPPAQSIIGTTEGAAYHQETFASNQMDYRPKIRGLIAGGLMVPASTYIKAQRIRNHAIRELWKIVGEYDCIITPSSVTPALKGLDSTGSAAFNSPWSFCGFPAITVPSGLSSKGLPLGIQLVCTPHDEVSLIQIAKWFEEQINFNEKPKPIF